MSAALWDEKVAVTGATGFVGKHLAPALLSSGARTVILGRSCERDFDHYRDGMRQVAFDLTDEEGMVDVLRRERPQILLHLAGTRGHGAADKRNAECLEVNFYATARLLKAATRAGIRRIVIIGSAEEYGNQPGPLHETLLARPATPYGVSKARATEFAVDMHKRNGCPVVILRPFTVYGPGQPPDMFVAEAVESAVRNVPFPMSKGEQRRDLIFIEDVVKAIMAAASKPGIEGRVINVGTGKSRRLRDVAESIWKIAGASSPLLIGARHATADQLYDTWADTALAKDVLAFESEVDLKTGLQKTIERAKLQSSERAKSCQVM